MIPSDRSDTEFDRIARRLTGEMSADERRAFDESADLTEALEESRGDWAAVSASHPVNVDAAWSRLQARLASGDAKVLKFKREQRWWQHSGGLLKAAAVLMFVAGSGVIWSRVSRTEVAEPVVAVTKPTERTTLELPDGSTVTLSASSSIRTREGYGTGAREVELVGEALFSVRHDEEHPFRVYTASALVEDLGTEFTVRAFASEPVRVSVSEGAVSVRRALADSSTAVVLGASDMVVLNESGDPLVARGVDVEAYSAWARGTLVFRNTALRDAIPDLERWYDLEFRVTDEALLSRPITVDFANQPVDEMLRVLGTMIEVQFERRGRTVTIEAPVRTGMTSSSSVQVGSGA